MQIVELGLVSRTTSPFARPTDLCAACLKIIPYLLPCSSYIYFLQTVLYIFIRISMKSFNRSIHKAFSDAIEAGIELPEV
jgi:hypothetical protein